MPAGIVVVGCDPIEAERLIDDRQGELGGVDGAFLQRLEDLAAGQHGHRRACPLDHPAADAGEADLQPLHVGKRFHRIAEPAGRFRARHAAEQDVRALLAIERLTQLPTAAFVPPGRKLPGLQAERHRTEQRRSGHLALVVAEPGVAHGYLAVADRIGDGEGGHDLAGLVRW